MPLAGAQSFALYASAAQPSASGWLLIGSAAAAPLSVGDAGISVDLHRPFRRIRATTDAFGYCENRIPIPAGSAGTAFAAQFAFPTDANCTAPTRWVTSNALRITVQ